MFILDHSGEKTEEITFPSFMEKGWLEKAINFLNLATLTPEQRWHYEMDIARNVAIENKIEEEKQEAIEAAVNDNTKGIGQKLKEKGWDVETISSITGLSFEEIEAL